MNSRRSRSLSSGSSNSFAPSSRSQSTIWRCTSGRDTRRRSGRGGKSPPRATRAGSIRSALPFLPHQEAVRQHHTHRMAMEPLPPPALILVPAQEPLGVLMEPLHPVPPVRILHQPLQSRIRTQVAPVILPLPVSHLLADQPTRPPVARGADPPGADRDESAPQPAVAPLAPGHRPPRPSRQGPDQGVGAPD